jgi:hypothetical protein
VFGAWSQDDRPAAREIVVGQREHPLRDAAASQRSSGRPYQENRVMTSRSVLGSIVALLLVSGCTAATSPGEGAGGSAISAGESGGEPVDPCAALDEAACKESDACNPTYGPSQCTEDGFTCTPDIVFKGCE